MVKEVSYGQKFREICRRLCIGFGIGAADLGATDNPLRVMELSGGDLLLLRS